MNFKQDSKEHCRRRRRRSEFESRNGRPLCKLSEAGIDLPT